MLAKSALDLKLRFLKKGDLLEMYQSFKLSFSDYSIPFSLSYPEFEKKFVEKLNINFELSPAAFDGEKLVAFIFTSTDYYQGQYTAYNGGTGVIPDYRGNHLVTKLYNYAIPVFKVRNIEQCVLEVLTDNLRAIRVYENVGFTKTKYYHCFRLEDGVLSKTLNSDTQIREVKKPDWKTYVKFYDSLPSFLDTEGMINNNLSNEKIIEVIDNGQTVAYAVFQPLPGRISHLAVSREYRHRGIGTRLVTYIHNDSRNKRLTIININKDATGLKDFLLKLGFNNQIDQYEMVKAI